MRTTGIDEDLLSTLGVLERDDPDVRDLALSGIGDPDGDHFVTDGQRAQPVAAADQQLPDDGREFERQLPLEAAGGAPVERPRDIDEQPGIEATIRQRLPDVGTIRPRRDVPFDGPRVVTGLILAHIAVLETGTAD